MAIAAAILLIVLTGLSLNRLGMFGSRTIPVTELASKIGEIRTVALEDGSRVTLDTDTRSEEHTSELQSLMRISYAVFCLKKKQQQTKNIKHRQHSIHTHHD